jgi:hypothetical protein
MAQFTSLETADPSGAKVNAVLDTVTNTITYTVTTASGFTATTSAPASEPGNSVKILNDIRQQITVQSGSGLATATALAGFGDSLNTVQVETVNQSTAAPAGVQETNPIPTNSTVDPAIPPPVDTSIPQPALTAPVDTVPYDEAALDQLVINEQQQASLEEYTNAAQAGFDTPEAQKQAEDQAVVAGIAAEQTIAENTQETARFAARGLSAEKQSAQGKATQQDVTNFKKKEDWRVRLSLAPNSNYLYNDPSQQVSDLLYPLKSTDGVIFPYTPAISVAYAAHYDSSTLTHSNYKIFQYGSSSVDSITITCDFTAQDTSEANYLLAVIHFFKSATKMFYGRDQNPKPGTPPPLCYLSGLGDFQFDAHPLAITGFNYTLPTDVDYVRAGRPSAGAGVNTSPTLTKDNGFLSAIAARLGILSPGAQAAPPKFGLTAAALQSTSDATYVPTKMSLSITAIPIVTRNDISNNFSLKDYATGKLLQGSKRQGGGIW